MLPWNQGHRIKSFKSPVFLWISFVLSPWTSWMNFYLLVCRDSLLVLSLTMLGCKCARKCHTFPFRLPSKKEPTHVVVFLRRASWTRRKVYWSLDYLRAFLSDGETCAWQMTVCVQSGSVLSSCLLSLVRFYCMNQPQMLLFFSDMPATAGERSPN